MSISLQPGSAPALSTSEPPRAIVPQRDLFLACAQRFEALAAGHSLEEWLRLLACLTHAQHEALQALPALPLPDAVSLARAREHGMPPLPAQHWPRDAAWRDALQRICGALDTAGAPQAVRDSCKAIAGAAPERLEALAAQVLRVELHGADAALLPYAAAALQVYWAALAMALGEEHIVALDVHGVCPCCGSLPVASVVRTAGDTAGLRYLHCSLCNTEWNMVRVKCAACNGNTKIAYRQLEGSRLPNAAAMRAETCDECHGYLKILSLEKAPDGDPVADDLATLALDMLLDEEGYGRIGPNLLFVPGGG